MARVTEATFNSIKRMMDKVKNDFVQKYVDSIPVVYKPLELCNNDKWRMLFDGKATLRTLQEVQKQHWRSDISSWFRFPGDYEYEKYEAKIKNMRDMANVVTDTFYDEFRYNLVQQGWKDSPVISVVLDELRKKLDELME